MKTNMATTRRNSTKNRVTMNHEEDFVGVGIMGLARGTESRFFDSGIDYYPVVGSAEKAVYFGSTKFSFCRSSCML